MEVVCGRCSTCRGSGIHPTLDTPCPTCDGTALSFRAVERTTTTRPRRYASESDAQVEAAVWFGGLSVTYRVVKTSPCDDHTGPGCPHCRDRGFIRLVESKTPIFGLT